VISDGTIAALPLTFNEDILEEKLSKLTMSREPFPFKSSHLVPQIVPNGLLTLGSFNVKACTSFPPRPSLTSILKS
jgi:hypothetical protein